MTEQKEALRSAILRSVFLHAQPDRGDVFSWLDDNLGRILAEPIVAAALQPPVAVPGGLVEMREALEPFANACTFSSFLDSDCIDGTLAANKITWGDLRRARKALTSTPSPVGGT